MLLCISSVSVQKAFLKEAKKRHFEECNDAWVQNLKRKKDTSKNATNMGSVPVKKALSREVDKRSLRRMQRYMGSNATNMGSVPVKKALSKKVDKRPLRRMQRYVDSVSVMDKRPLRRMQRYMDSLSVHEALSKEVDKRSLRRMQRTWVQYRCIKHYPRKWIKDHYEECNEHGFSTDA
ncbi:hypothetical protein T4B_2468 [Trichinella pseudospiralis]|uniref:Uncharacterized protein n=1 Tax=Trichinella pseudospiralis TaxID=6337 RepID=A0A0V1GKY5_TRIPS|nr:hypothetical protein T4B_2468 [Trichinella pseudospiralis]